MSDLGFFALSPAILAVVLALWTRHVILSLGASVWLGATLVVGGNPITGLVHAVDPFLLDAIADRDHVKVTVFSLLVAATVGVMGAGGGTKALVGLFVKLAKTRRSGMLASWIAGLMVFFDDYANCLIVGSSMRGLADRLGISREKLAYIVDSTAAPIASIALVSTWVGYEVGLMKDGLEAAGQTMDAYAFFVEGIGYRSYCIFTIFFVGAIALTGRDFGPMRQAEARAQAELGEGSAGELDTGLGKVLLGIVPIAVLIGVTFGKLWIDGSEGLPAGAKLFEVLGNADGYDAMLQASLSSTVVAVLIASAFRLLTPMAALDAAMKGMTQLFEALCVLFLAWSLGSAMGALNAADVLVAALGDALNPAWLPTLTFVVASATAFATGTSFGTMGILIPLVLPLSFGISDDMVIHLASSGAVLAGACWGDHCSPISDTTVLSSAGADCDHVEHVRTQLPYALACGAIAIVFGTVPAGFGVTLWLTIPAGIAACFATVWVLGKR